MSRWIFPVLALGLLLVAGCRQSGQGLEGTYDSEDGNSSHAQLLLRSDGGGALAVGAEEAPFRWEVRGDGGVLLHTRQGGVILARQQPEGLVVNMPGQGNRVFRRQQK